MIWIYEVSVTQLYSNQSENSCFWYNEPNPDTCELWTATVACWRTNTHTHRRNMRAIYFTTANTLSLSQSISDIFLKVKFGEHLECNPFGYEYRNANWTKYTLLYDVSDRFTFQQQQKMLTEMSKVGNPHDRFVTKYSMS